MGDNHREHKIRLTRTSLEYWRVTFDLPPLNIFGPSNIPQLEAVVSSIESNDRVKVVVFDSAVDGFFLTHYDFFGKARRVCCLSSRTNGLQPLPDMLEVANRLRVAERSARGWLRTPRVVHPLRNRRDQDFSFDDRVPHY